MTAPKLRLAGFKEPWSPKRLGATGRILHERTSDFARYPLYSLTIEKGVTKKTERYERGFLVSKTGDIFKIVHPGNFVTNPMNLRFGAVGYSKEKDDVSVSGYYDVFELDDNKCSPFWFNFLKRGEMKKRYEDIATGSLIEKKRVHVNDLLNLELPIPELEERMSIGQCFASQARVIDAEELRLESLRMLKSACLEKMFTQNGDLQPRLRMGAFKGAWTQCKLGACFEERQDRSKNGELLSVSQSLGVIRFSESGRRNTSNVTSGNYKVVCLGDIAYNSMRMWQGASGCSSYEGIVSPAYTVVRPIEGVDSRFAAIVFKTADMLRKFRIYSQGLTSDTWNLKYPQFAEIEWTIPPTVAEQSAIADYFERLDEAISLQGNRIKRLKNLKTACMERMFV